MTALLPESGFAGFRLAESALFAIVGNPANPNMDNRLQDEKGARR